MPSRVVGYWSHRTIELTSTEGIAAGRVAADLCEDTSIHANVDVVSIGIGVARRLEEQLGDCASGINVGERADEPDRFINKKAELYRQLRTPFEQGAS